MKSLHVLVAGTALTLVTLCGCSSERSYEEVDVSGAVTVDGEPIPAGSIMFIATDAQSPSGGGVIKDGRYVAKVPPGEKKVLIVGNKVVGTEPLYDTPNSPTRDKLETITPPSYNAEHLTPLTADITGPVDNLDFDVKTNGPGM